MRILVLGASGMLGNAVLRLLNEQDGWDVYGTLRSPNLALQKIVPTAQLITDIHADQPCSLTRAFFLSQPNVVINCIGLVKQLASADDPLEAIPINALLPHRIAKLCELTKSRLVHISTDCVFSGIKGNYTEADFPDATDLYGRSKLIGEPKYSNSITLRTSIIGHELENNHGLIEWFLSQQLRVKGYTHALFSGLPTCELAWIILNLVIPKPELSGLYHVAANPISKYDLLQIVNKVYGKALEIEVDDSVKINRSLDSTSFKLATGYVAPAWSKLIAQMREFG